MLTNADVVTLPEAGLSAAVTFAKTAATSTDFDARVERPLALSEMEVDATTLVALATGSRSHEAGFREHRPPCRTPVTHERPSGYRGGRLHVPTAHGQRQPTGPPASRSPRS